MAEPITVTIQGLNSPIATVKVQNKLSESAVTSVAGRVGDVLLTNADIAGLENVNNTSDLNKPISIATQAALDLKPDSGDFAATVHQHVLADITNAGTAAAADTGDFATSSHQHLLSDITDAGTAAASDTGDFATSAQGALADSALQNGDNISLLTNDAGYLTSFTGAVDSVNGQSGVVVLDADDIDDTSTAHKFVSQSDINKLSSVASGAEVNVNADWNSVGGDSQILNKPAFGDITGSDIADFAPASHNHVVADITDLNTGLFSQTGHTHVVADITDLNTGIFSTTGHTHTISDITDAGTMISANTGDYQLVSQKGIANGYASLDGGGKVPSAQLPSYVDDVLEYPNFASLPVTGEFGKIYVTLDNGKIYRWTGTIYVEISSDAGAPVLSVNSLTGVVVLDPDDLDDSATTNKFTTQAEIDKLASIVSGAEANVNADWNATSGDAEILNKPALGTMATEDTGDYSQTGHQHVLADITNAGTMAAADTGDYSLTGHQHVLADITDAGTMASADSSDYSQTGHQHFLSDIFDAGTSASYDVANIGDAADDEVVKGDDSRLDWSDVLGTSAYLDVNPTGDALSSEVVKGSDSRLSDNRDPNPHTHTNLDIDSTGSTDGQVLTSDGSGNANWETPTTFSIFDATATVYVSKDGSDSDNGLSIDEPMLTIGSGIAQASNLIGSGASGVRIEVLDGETYQESITVDDGIHINAPSATLVGEILVDFNGGSNITPSVVLNKHFAVANSNRLVESNIAGASIFYKCNQVDTRGIGGSLTSVQAIANFDSGTFTVDIGTIHLGSSAIGINCGGGTIQGSIGDIFFGSGSSGAYGINASSSAVLVSLNVGFIGSTIGSPTNETCIRIVGSANTYIRANRLQSDYRVIWMSSGAVLNVIANELDAGSGDVWFGSASQLYVSCPRIIGNRNATITTLREISNNTLAAQTQVTAADVDAELSTDGQVLVSDGLGAANWETLSANDVSGVAIIYEDASAVGYPATVGKFPTNYPIFDSISTSGDPRGLGSVDLQMRRTVSNQVASSQYSTILGGGLNRINASGVNAGLGSTVCGGSSNLIDNGQYAIILGGQNNKVGDYPTSAGSDSVVCGRYAHAKHNKTFVFSSEPTTVPFETLQTETFNIKAANGLRLITDGSQTAGQALVCDANGHGDWATINVGDVNGALQSGDNVSLLTNDANYTSSGDNVSLFVNDTGYLLSGDNISLLNNDLNYDQTTPTNVTGAMATALLAIDPTPELLDGVFVRYDDGGSNKIKLTTLQSIANQSPVISVNGLTGSVVLDPDDLDDELTNHKFASASQLANADSALQSGDNVSLLTNDANYTSSGDNVSLFANDSLYVASGDNISQFNNDAGYITSAGAVSFNYRAETGNYNVTGTDYTIDCISGSQTITLPNASGIQGQIFVVKNSSTGVVTITGTASQTFDGYDSLETDFPQSLTLQSTNTNWIII